MSTENKELTLFVDGQKTKVGVQPIHVVVIDDKGDEKPVSSNGKGTHE